MRRFLKADAGLQPARIALLGPCALLVALLPGCTAQTAYGDGKMLLTEGKVEEGMAKFEEALQTDPRDPRYRSAYLQTRERALTTAADQADKALGNDALDEAQTLYRHALSINPSYERALDGLAGVEVRRRQIGWLDEAEVSFSKNQLDIAGQKIARVLTEAPKDQRALALRRAIDAKRGFMPPEARLEQIYKKPITIEFKDVTLKQVFEVISHTSGLNFLFDKDVKTDQKTSIFLQNSNIEATVNYVLLTNQLDRQILDGNTILIYPNSAAKQKDYQELDVRTFYLGNAEAKTVANTLKTILKLHDIAIDEKLNMIVIRDTPDAIKMAEKLVAAEDVAEPEVMLEVEVLEVARTWLQDLGMQWPASVAFQPTSASGAANVAATAGSDGTSGSGTSSGSTGSTISLFDLQHQTSRSLGVTVGSVTANANLTDSDSKLLTNPRIRVRNHEKAKILIGERVPNITSTATSTGFLSQSINYIDVGLTLNVEPTIYLDDNVGIKISLEVSSIITQIPTQSGTTAYEIGTRTASTSLRLKDGETDVLAGLLDTQERTSGNKVPGLADLPLIGRLFGATTDDDENTEIVLSITPHLIRNIRRPDVANALFNSGTETSLRSTTARSGGESSFAAPPSSTASAASSSAGVEAEKSAAPGDANGSGAFGSSGSNGLTDNGLPQGGDNSNAAAQAAASGDFAAGGAVAPGTVQLQWQGPAQATVGGTVALDLSAQSTQPVSNLPVTISFDNSKLEVVNITEGPFLKENGGTTNFSSRLSGNGQLTLSDTNSSGAGATSAAVFATISFKALAAAPSTSIQVLSSSPTGVGSVPVSLIPPAPFSLTIKAP